MAGSVASGTCMNKKKKKRMIGEVWTVKTMSGTAGPASPSLIEMIAGSSSSNAVALQG